MTESETVVNEDQIREAIKKIFNEELEVNLTKTTYDTNKPIDPDTKKPPIKEEANLNLKKKSSTTKNQKTEENITSKQEQMKVDKTSKETEIDQSDKGTE